MNALVVLALLVLAFGSRPAAEERLLALLERHGSKLLDGYRLPGLADLKHDWAWFHKGERKIPYRISADFNGDGRSDHAFVLLGQGSHRVRVGALVSAPGGYRAFELADYDAGSEYSQYRYVVAVVPPGRYRTAKGRGHNVPAEDPDELVLSNPAIDLIHTESSDRFFFWDPRRGAFRDVAITD